MKPRLMTVFLLIILTIPSLQVLKDADASDQIAVKAEDPIPTRELSSNVTGGLYDGLITYEDVALIVNDNSGMSKEIGTYFAVRRGLPEINIINISVPEQEIITESEYDELARQVRENLSTRGLTDKINYFVTTKGVPLKVTSGEYNMNRQDYYRSASVDSELMLMDSNLEYNVHGLYWEDNPYAGAGTPFSREAYGIRLVTRLTGYTTEEAMGLVDRAETSFSVRGNALLDMDPTKNGSSGYRQGNQWMVDAHNWLIENGYPSHLDADRDFITGWTDTMAYYSWGSNDGDWGEGQMTNGGFETGTGTSATGWTYEETGGIASRMSESTQSGSWALKLERTGTGVLRAYQDIGVNYPDHRFILDGRMSISSVTSPGARILLEGYDQNMAIKWTHTLANRTGSRGFDAYQDPIENHTEVTTLRLILELLGDGVAYFDSMNLRVVRPHNEWLNGSIAETIVSTGGRSMTYGTWYGQSLVADIIRDGVTGIKGYTWEPFITAVSRAHILIPAYYLGYSLAESFWMGSPFVSWMGTVIGDPKCTPFINERPDIGPALDEVPIRSWVDEDGIPGITVVLYNKGNRTIDQSKVEFFMEGDAKFHTEIVDIPVGGKVEINLSSSDHPIIGKHTFTVVLDPDGEIWEFDEKNNEIISELSVNYIPTLEVELPSTRVVRTDPFIIRVTLGDLDGDISLDMLEFLIEGPTGTEYLPQLNWSNYNLSHMEAEYLFVPPWDASLGFHSLMLTYTDPLGSYVSQDLGPSIRVLNADPVISGKITRSEVERGGTVDINVTWMDNDSPDGLLDLDIFAQRPSGGKLLPQETMATSNWSATFRFNIPPEELSNTWTFTAEVLDRNGGGGSWTDYIRSYNQRPTLEVLNGTGAKVTRIGQAKFIILYHDPEGLPSGKINAMVTGPQGAPSSNVVFTKDLDLNSDEALELLVPANGLLLGNYTLDLSYEDDEGDGDELSILSAFSVNNIDPVIESLYISYPHGEGVYGETFLRSRSVTLTLNVQDLDSEGTGLTVLGTVFSNDRTVEHELFFDLRGEDTFITKVSTEGSWPLGTYGIEITVRDPDRDTSNLDVQNLFVLDAETPFLQTGELFLNLDLSATVEATFGRGPGSTSPSSLMVHLYSIDGDLIVSEHLSEKGSEEVWAGVIQLATTPAYGDLQMVDDDGRTIWFNDSLSIDIEKEPVKPQGSDPNNNDQTLVILLVLLAIVLVLAVLVIIGALVLRNRSEGTMMPAPPPFIGLEPQHISTLGPATREALPPTSSPEAGSTTVPLSVPPLSPGTALQDGSSYHKPEQSGPQQGPPSRSVIAENVPFVTIREENGPEPPVMENGEDPSASSEPTNTPSVVDPPEPYVRDTDNSDIPGDTG